MRKNKTEEVGVALSEFQGRPLIDVRVFADYRDPGERGPTKKGASLNVASLSELIEALTLAQGEAVRRGLIAAG